MPPRAEQRHRAQQPGTAAALHRPARQRDSAAPHTHPGAQASTQAAACSQAPGWPSTATIRSPLRRPARSAAPGRGSAATEEADADAPSSSGSGTLSSGQWFGDVEIMEDKAAHAAFVRAKRSGLPPTSEAAMDAAVAQFLKDGVDPVALDRIKADRKSVV